MALPYVELAAAVLLLTGFYSRWAGLTVAVLLVSFMVAVGVVMARGQHLDCSCFGLLYQEQVGWATQARDGVLLALALFVAVADRGALALPHLLGNPGRPLYLLALGGTAATIALSLLVASLSLRQAHKTVRSHQALGYKTPGLFYRGWLRTQPTRKAGQSDMS